MGKSKAITKLKPRQAEKIGIKHEFGIKYEAYLTKSKGTQTYTIATPAYEARFGTPFVKQAMSQQEEVARLMFIVEKADGSSFDIPMCI